MEMRRNARGSKGKAGGMDRLSGDLHTILPKEYYEQLEEVWDKTLEVGKIPHLWKYVRNVAIDQKDESETPRARRG